MIPIPTRLEHRIDGGGFGDVFQHPTRPGMVVKRFREPFVGPDAAALRDLRDVISSARPSDHDFAMNRVAWPIELFGKETEIHGYSMMTAPATAYFDLRTAGRLERRLLQAKYVINKVFFDAPSITSPPPRFTDTHRLESIVDLYRVLSFLHQNGFSYGDVSSNNICLQIDTHARVFLLDADSIRRIDDPDAPHQESPDWTVNEQFDRQEVDRARFAIFAWRLFTQNQFFYPMRVDIEYVDRQAKVELGESLLELFKTGGADLFDEVATIAQRALGTWGVSSLVEFDLLERYARRVLFWKSSLLTPELRDLQRRASVFCTMEARSEEARGLERRILLRRLRASAEFLLDLQATEASAPPPSTARELEDLVSTARFAEIAQHLGTNGLGDLERHRWIDRATRHALLTDTVLIPTVTKSLDRATISWSWPEERWVNAAHLDVTVDGISTATLVERPLDSSPIVRELVAPPAAQVQIDLFPAVRASGGRVVTGPKPARAKFTSPDRSRPSDLAVSSGFEGADGFFNLQIIDPEEERRERAHRLRRRRQKWALQGAAASALIAVALVAMVWFRSDPMGNPRLDDRTSGRALLWSLADVAPEDGLRSFTVQRSSNELLWYTVASLKPSERGVFIPYRVGTASEYFRVVAEYGTRRLVIGAPALRVPDVSNPSAVSTAQVKKVERGYEIRWGAPVAAGGTAIDRYELRYGSTTGVAEDRWIDTIIVPASGLSDERRLHRLLTQQTGYVFQVRAVNLAGLVGPWTTPSNQQES